MSVVLVQSAVRALQQRQRSPSPPPPLDSPACARNVMDDTSRKSIEDFGAELVGCFGAALDTERLLAISLQLQSECAERLACSDISMLPSYQHTLPTGYERGEVLALDVGGSTFRVALIRLAGRSVPGTDGLHIRRIRNFAIDEHVRRLKGSVFFDWMAERIAEMLDEHCHHNAHPEAPLPVGLAWSFPVEQTSPRTGRLLAMGKGFSATHGVEGQDLSELIMSSCRRAGLNVQMRAIVNDGAATLLSQAYRDPTTRMSLILGTGTNAAVYLPVPALGAGKFGQRPDSWYEQAQHVLVNTELSMLGKHSLPLTPWDERLNAAHSLPDFQPLEYLVTGRYLGEIVRLVLRDAVDTAGLFHGHVPDRLDEAYTLDSRILAAFERDSTPGLSRAAAYFLQAHPLPVAAPPPRAADLEFVSAVARLVSRRAAAYLATALHALWRVRTACEGLAPAHPAARLTVACNGTIVEKYPGYRDRCQRRLDELCVASGAAPRAIALTMAPESSIFGAAVAVACMEGV